MADDCVFCKIVNGDIHADEVMRTEDVVAFRDVSPVAPVHILVVPVEHFGSIAEISDETVGGKMLSVASQVAESEGIAESGFRIVANTGRNAGQSVAHVHIHLIGGRHMAWPPG